MEIKIQSYTSAFNSIYRQIEQAVPNHTELIWSYHKSERRMGTEQLMELLLKGVDLVLVSLDQVQYPLNNNLGVLAVFANGADKHNPLLLLALNQQLNLDASVWDDDLRNSYGQVYIAGFGPGNPDLLTLKTQRLIKEADVIFYDDLLDDDYLKQFTAELVYVGKRKGKHSTKQENINQLLYESALEGKKILRLKGGDPLIFGRGAEEYHYLAQRHVDVEIVPGITSALAAASDAVIPLTSRGTSTSVAFTLGHDAVYNKLPEADTLVFYMGASQQQRWAQRLIDEGWPENTPVACVHNASMPEGEMKRYVLSDLKTAKVVLPAPALLIVGQTVVNTGEKSKKWLYTGMELRYFNEKGQVVHNPLVKIESTKLSDHQVSLLNNLRAFDRIVFATPYAVHEFFKALFQVGLDVRALNEIALSSIGTSTTEALQKYGLIVEPESKDNSAKGLVQSFHNKKIENEAILLPCSEDGLSILPEKLQEMGNHIHELKIYKSILPDNAVRHNLEDFYGVVLTSPKVVHHFFKLHDTLPADLKFKVRGNYTKKVLDEYLTQLKLHNDAALFSIRAEYDG